MAHVVVEDPVAIPVSSQVFEGIFCRKVFELDNQLWKDFGHGSHELIHKFIHLYVPKTVNHTKMRIAVKSNRLASASLGLRCLTPR